MCYCVYVGVCMLVCVCVFISFRRRTLKLGKINASSLLQCVSYGMMLRNLDVLNDKHQLKLISQRCLQ